jgi:hypothetical protein
VLVAVRTLDGVIMPDSVAMLAPYRVSLVGAGGSYLNAVQDSVASSQA